MYQPIEVPIRVPATASENQWASPFAPRTKGIHKSKYNALRIVRTIINVGVIVCVLLLMVSGVMLSNHVFAWLGIESGASFARNAHMLASHWYLHRHHGVVRDVLIFLLQTELRKRCSVFSWTRIAPCRQKRACLKRLHRRMSRQSSL